jgi:beta-galactosidase GanA
MLATLARPLLASRMNWRSLCAAFALFSLPLAAEAHELPHLRQQGEAVQLIVDDAPFLILGGELANSSASNLDYLRPHWRDFEAMHLNTVLAPVYWELIEPEEGRFDFALVDGMIRDARRHHMRLVLLWFGAWKNSMSSYAPAWVKRDPDRFPRARDADGHALEMLTAFSSANVAADARAFAALMAHLRDVDGARHTVIMVQVENEIGMIPSARDHGPLAEAAMSVALPDAQAEERFMARAYARYVEQVAAAGKAAYPLPMYVNAALPRPGRAPGDYPSAGPLPHLAEIWRAGAPSIDLLAPDIYFPNFTEWTDRYAALGRGLFIPEAGRAGAAEAPANAFYAFGAHDALGFSPFSIDSVESAERDRLAGAYLLLAQLSPLILAHQGDGSMVGVRAPAGFDGAVDESPQRFSFGDTTLTATLIDPWTPRDAQNIAAHGGLIVQLAPNEFLIAGAGLTVTFAAGGGGAIGIERAEEGTFADGVWKPIRVMNGDQTHQGRHVRLAPDAFSVQRVRVYTYH